MNLLNLCAWPLLCATRMTMTLSFPNMWANEGLAILEESMVMAAKLVHRDFENEVRDYGDVVNTRRPGEFHDSAQG
jgi:hypothetical protein